MMSKQMGTIMCATCHSKTTSLYRGFGKWPTKEFKGLPDDAKIQFWNDIKKIEGTDALCAKANHVIESYEIKEEHFAENGDFRPLKFWDLQGYDIERIQREARPEDKRELRLSGLCYRVPVMSTGMKTLYGRDRREQVRVPVKKKKGVQ